MGKINFNMTASSGSGQSSNKNKKVLLEAGSYNSKIMNVAYGPKGNKNGKALTITFGIFDITKGGYYTFLYHDIYLKHESDNFLSRSLIQLNNLIQELNISPDIFDDEIGVTMQDMVHLLEKKLVIQVDLTDETFKEPGTGKEIQYKKNKIIGFSSVGTVKQTQTDPSRPLDQPMSQPVQTIPNGMYQNRTEIPPFATDDDSLNGVIPY